MASSSVSADSNDGFADAETGSLPELRDLLDLAFIFEFFSGAGANWKIAYPQAFGQLEIEVAWVKIAPNTNLRPSG